jgi:hypothetical protein
MPRPTTCLFVRIPFTALARHPEAHCADRGKSTSVSTASQSKKSLDRNCNLISLEGYQKLQFKRFRHAISNSISVDFSVLNRSQQLVVDRIWKSIIFIFTQINLFNLSGWQPNANAFRVYWNAGNPSPILEFWRISAAFVAKVRLLGPSAGPLRPSRKANVSNRRFEIPSQSEGKSPRNKVLGTSNVTVWVVQSRNIYIFL